MSLRKKCPYSEFFCSVFFYLEILRISPYSVRIWENKDQKNSEYNTYHGVCNGVITRYFLLMFGFSYTFHFSLFFLSFYFFVVSLVKLCFSLFFLFDVSFFFLFFVCLFVFVLFFCLLFDCIDSWDDHSAFTRLKKIFRFLINSLIWALNEYLQSKIMQKSSEISKYHCIIAYSHYCIVCIFTALRSTSDCSSNHMDSSVRFGYLP